MDQILNHNLILAGREYQKFKKNIPKIDEIIENLETKLKNERKNLNEDDLKDLKIFENETNKIFQKIINNQNFNVINEKEKFVFGKFDPRLIHVDKRTKVFANNLVMLNDINNSIEQETKKLEQKYFDIKFEATQKCKELSSQLKDCYVVHK